MRPEKLTDAQEKRLRDQVITLDQPGSILRDFGMLLDFLGTGPVEAAGKYNLLPIKFIDELDGRLSRPLHLDLKRPQIRSHPYLQGLNLVLRASGLSRIEGSGARARMMLDPAMMAIWDGLNPTERYFNLLEAWLRFGRAEMIGERGLAWQTPLSTVLMIWSRLPAKGMQVQPVKARRNPPFRDLSEPLPARPDGPVRAPGRQAALPAGHPLGPGQRPSQPVRRCRTHPARFSRARYVIRN